MHLRKRQLIPAGTGNEPTLVRLGMYIALFLLTNFFFLKSDARLPFFICIYFREVYIYQNGVTVGRKESFFSSLLVPRPLALLVVWSTVIKTMYLDIAETHSEH